MLNALFAFVQCYCWLCSFGDVQKALAWTPPKIALLRNSKIVQIFLNER